MPQPGQEQGQQLAKDMAIIYINMLSQAHKNTKPQPNSWEGLEVAPRLVSPLPDEEVRLGLARLLPIDFRIRKEILRVLKSLKNLITQRTVPVLGEDVVLHSQGVIQSSVTRTQLLQVWICSLGFRRTRTRYSHTIDPTATRVFL